MNTNNHSSIEVKVRVRLNELHRLAHEIYSKIYHNSFGQKHEWKQLRSLSKRGKRIAECFGMKGSAKYFAQLYSIANHYCRTSGLRLDIFDHAHSR